MKPHKWAKEIKAWADGAEIEYNSYDIWDDWNEDIGWYEGYEYRIKPQPKEPQYLYAYIDTRYGKVGFSTGWEKDSAMPLIGKIKLEVNDE